MSLIGNYLKSNLPVASNIVSAIFTLLGIVVTLYASIFYVPSYIQQQQSERDRSINTALVASVQELIYRNDELTLEEIEALVGGVQIRENTKYKYSVDELLIQAQEAFLSNKFIAPKTRQDLTKKLESVRVKFKQKHQLEGEGKGNNQSGGSWSTRIDWISIGVGLIGFVASVLGIWSAFVTIVRNRSVDVDARVQRESTRIQRYVSAGFLFQEFVSQALNSQGLGVEQEVKIPSGVADFIVKTAHSTAIVEVTVDQLSRPTPILFRRLERFALGEQTPVIFVTRGRKRATLQSMVDSHNRSNPQCAIHYVCGENDSEIKEALVKAISLVNAAHKPAA